MSLACPLCANSELRGHKFVPARVIAFRQRLSEIGRGQNVTIQYCGAEVLSPICSDSIKAWKGPSELPTTRYAKSGNVHVAYQVFGEGEIDLVFFPGFVSNIETYWEEPSFRPLAPQARRFRPRHHLRQTRHWPVGPPRNASDHGRAHG